MTRSILSINLSDANLKHWDVHWEKQRVYFHLWLHICTFWFHRIVLYWHDSWPKYVYVSTSSVRSNASFPSTLPQPFYERKALENAVFWYEPVPCGSDSVASSWPFYQLLQLGCGAALLLGHTLSSTHPVCDAIRPGRDRRDWGRVYRAILTEVDGCH